MNIVFLETDSLGEGLDLKRFEAYGNVTYYDASTTQQTPARVKDADIVITNKIPMNEQTLGDSHVKLVCLTATGSDNLDKPYLKQRGIAWHNAAGYSTEPVAQHTFALYFYLAEKLRTFDDFVKSGGYAESTRFTYYGRTPVELWNKTWGIIGMGTIGHRVAEIATAFGAKVIYYSTSGKNTEDRYEQVSLDELLAQSDTVSIHAPLNDVTEGMVDEVFLKKMKPTAYLINVARGKVVNDKALADALEQGVIAGAGLDVVSREPILPDNPLLRIKDSERLIITPHIGWASLEARKRLMQIVEQHVADYVGNPVK